MFELPTDKLCKFFAVGGLLMALLGASIAIDRYHQAELRRIDAEEKANAAQAAYARLKDAVGRQSELSRQVRSEGDPRQQINLLNDFWKLNDETEKLKGAVDIAIIDLRKHGDLNRHFAFMRTLWLWIGGACLAFGVLASVLGFLRWRHNESRAGQGAG